MLHKTLAVAQVIILDGLRRYALLGLILLALTLEIGGLLFADFIPRDIGRATGDFVLTVGWFMGVLFLLFHAVHVLAWDEDRRIIHTLLARPISRAHYVVGIFIGLATLLLMLNVVLAGTGYGILKTIGSEVDPAHAFAVALASYLLSWIGLYCIQIMLLSVIVLFSSLIRGSFAVLLLSVSYMLICSSLPVVRDAFQNAQINEFFPLNTVMKYLTVVFPDFSRFDFKSHVTEFVPLTAQIGTNFAVFSLYVLLILIVSIHIYKNRDLQ